MASTGLWHHEWHHNRVPAHVGEKQAASDHGQTKPTVEVTPSGNEGVPRVDVSDEDHTPTNRPTLGRPLEKGEPGWRLTASMTLNSPTSSVGAMLQGRLERRSTREELEAKGILHKSNVAHVAKKLARRSLSSTLEAQLSKRPTREELMEEGWIAARTLPTLQVSGEYEAMQHGATYTPGLESPKIHLKLQHGLFDERTTVLTPSFSLYDDESYF